MEYFRKIQDSGHHECEMFEGEGQSEAAQSSRKWKKCTKNPGHEKFITVQEFQQNLVIKVPDVIDRERISAVIDRTVRLKVYYTSKDRPDDDPFSALKGTKIPRYGTGNVENNRRLGFRGKDPFLGVQRGVKTHWEFIVQTAQHVVFNTEEARATKVDFFFDDESCERDGRMKSATGVEVLKRGSGRDMTEILCTTCDEDLARRILSAQRHSKFAQIDLHQWFPSSCDGERDPVVIVSHPHGQPKKITVGTHTDTERLRYVYTASTCPGSSGARVTTLGYLRGLTIIPFRCTTIPSVHSGSYTNTPTDHEEQRNYSNMTNKISGV